MTWPGSQIPPGVRSPRRRRGKVRRPYHGPPATVRTIVKLARAAGVASKATRTHDTVARCLDHAAEACGFPGDPWGLAKLIESLATQRHLTRGNLRLPSWVTPRGVRAIAVRCRACGGTGLSCSACEGFGWGVRFRQRVAGAA